MPIRRSVLLLCVLSCGLAVGARADAHALLQRSVPERGAVLQRAPDAATLTFTEPPDPTLSVIHVQDRSGRSVERGAIQAVPGQPFTLRVPLGALPNGTYTVTWRAVSRIDGHVTGGTFEFGIGAAAVSLAEDTTPQPSALYVLSRLVLYAGVIGLMGTALARVPMGPPRQTSFSRSLWGFWALAAAGVALLGLGQAIDTGAGLGRLLGTPLGRALWWRMLPIAAAAPAMTIAQRSPQYRGSALGVLCGLSALAMVAHIVAGHAAAGSGLGPWRAMFEQWVHFGSIGVWAGALLALRVVARGAPGDAAAVRLCSLGAAGALGIAAVTGALRAQEELGSWFSLLSTEFGRLVLAKTGLFLLLALLGAWTRRLVLSQKPDGAGRLGRLVTAEVAVAVAILAITAFMTGLALPGATSGAPSPTPRTISESGKTPLYLVALSGGRTLTISLDPGGPGLNALHATFTDAGGRELDIARVSEITLGRTGETPRGIAVLQEGPGHFYSDVELTRGDWRLRITAITRAGETLRAQVVFHL